ncbi:MAG: hypothetical protein QM811_26080 [Pirellulales bacterium]
MAALTGCGEAAGPSADDLNRMNAFELFQAAAGAAQAGRNEDAVVYHTIAQARFAIDVQVFPPVADGGNHPNVLKSALNAGIVPLLAHDGVAANAAAARLATWTPRFDQGYDPGWEYANRLDATQAAARLATIRKAILEPLERRGALRRTTTTPKPVRTMPRRNAKSGAWKTRRASRANRFRRSSTRSNADAASTPNA